MKKNFFKVNTNIGNSGNVQMAGGMAMSGRIFDIQNINNLRTRYCFLFVLRATAGHSWGRFLV
jgi:hypothetical protein